MTPKTILFPLRIEQPVAELEAAVDFCRNNDAHLSVLLIGLAPPPPVATDTVVISDNWAAQSEAAKQELHERGSEIEQHLAKAGISAEIKRWLMMEHSIEAGTAEHALFADVTFLSRTFPQERGFARQVVSGVVFGAGRPIIVADPAQFGTLSWGTILIGWDNEKPAARAVAEALPLLAAADNVHILCVDPDAVPQRDGEAPGWDLATYLARHGVQTTVHTQPSGGNPVATVLADFAEDLGADGLVMGAYGHSRLRQRLLGGTTRSLIETGKLPILMAH
ncbi:MAG: universal stress protein [Oricola sp.]|nr:MAG: universal stress protein [Oricola sp.]